MSVYRHPKQEPRERAKRSPEDIALYVVAILFGMLPFVWLFATGKADPLDLGVATLIVIAALTALLQRRSRRTDSP